MQPVQDYDKIRRHCLTNNSLFEDSYFPANDSSLFSHYKLPFSPKWMRPKDIVSKPKLFAGGASRFDVSQGMLGNCWLVAAIASLTQDRILLKKVIPDDQGFDKGYTGMFHFKLWHFGESVDVVIDDRLPTRDKKLIFIHSNDEDEFWSALLEKAYAKLYGSYEALKGGKTSEAMEDFTGGVVETLDLKKADYSLFSKIEKNFKKASLMSTSIAIKNAADIEAKLDNGLVKGHAYSVTGATKVQAKGKEVNLVRIRNPWGQKEWNGDWSDKSSTWKDVPTSERKKVLEENMGDDGEFWMSFDDMKKTFTDFEICNITVDQLYEDDSVKNWNAMIINGCWNVKEGTAGGCRNNSTFAKNPQYAIELSEDDDGDGKCSCLVALMQKHRRKQKKLGAQDLTIGFSVYKAPKDGTSVLTQKYVDYNHSVGNSGAFTNAREVHARFDFHPGTYIIVPCTYKPEQEGEFLIRIFTEKSSQKKNTKLKEMFSRLGGTEQMLQPWDLQDMLTSALSTDMNPVFSLDECRALVAMLDKDKKGSLDHSEYQSLLQTIGLWKKMFFKYDRDRSGVMEKHEAHEAVKSLGYGINQDVFTTLFNRFSVKREYMRPEDFARCLCRLKTMNDTFDRLNNYKSSGSVKLSRDEFLKVTMDA